ncbi:putative ferrichrome transport system permease protein FhuG [Aneurinibacillus aneurinilyticus ATCC 12856]|uniref:Putative ferrichrome transport system permease protein FhuG n=2 Tax=Aneurinibacillus aneurinilyticus TaxID=1391 RepID=U1X753_ANEAE|nr:putative ferrichrome transport system permease protein FhuG [Aneurinibacillus aneurinilyticus ATCC 12856]
MAKPIVDSNSMNNVSSNMFPKYGHKQRRNIKVLITLGLLIVIAFVLSMNTGFIRLSPLDTIRTLFGGGSEKEQLILFDFRLPRIVISLLIGSGLAVSGCIMQSISRNALADPGILGINAGAGLVVLVFVAYYPNLGTASIFLLPVLAWIGAGLTAVIIFSLSYKRHKGLLPTRLLLTGVAVAAGISAATIVITLRINPEKYQFVATWMAGSIWGANWKFVLVLLPFIVILLPFVFSKAGTMNVLNLGEMTAIGLGTKVYREQIILLGAAVGLAGSCVAVSGSIGFVGLIGPHLARRLVGQMHQALLPASALIGSLMVIVADMLGRLILQPSEIPAGIIVTIVGAPYFLYLLAHSR